MADAQERLIIRPVRADDSKAITDLYNYYVETSIVTFEEEATTASEIGRRIEAVQSTTLPWLVVEENGELFGYAYATPWRSRTAYRFSVEVTVYVAPGRLGVGVGSMLYGRLLPMLRAQHIHAVLGVIALPNDASVALHEKFGFKKVALLKEVGFKFDRWIDVGYWQLQLSSG